MPNPYAFDLRERAVAAFEAGEGTYAELAEQFVVHPRTLQKWVRRKRTTGSVAALPKGGGWHSPVKMDVLDTVIREKPDRTTDELTRAYNRLVPKRHRVHRSSVFRALARAAYVCKKNAPARLNRTGPMSTAAAAGSGARSGGSIRAGS